MSATEKRAWERELTLLNSQRDLYFARVQKLYDNSRNIDNTASLNTFVMKLKSLEDTKTDFIKTIKLINELTLKLDDNAVPNYKALDSFDDLYCSILVKADDPRVKTAMGINNSTSLPRDVESHPSTPRLPKLSLPTFSGNIREWPIFYECFKSLIHDNNNLSDVDKVNYLVGQLSDQAKNICVGLPPIGSNYMVIWDALVEKYQNERALATNYLEQILELKPAQIASANTLNNILETCDSAFRALQKLKIPDLLDFTYAYLLWTKLDPHTRNLFENSRKQSTVLKYEEISKFIKEQAQIHTLSPSSSKVISGNTKKQQTFFVANNQNPKCVICDSKQHFKITRCPKFLAKTPSDRYTLIKEKNLCINCFGQHKVVACKNSMLCKICRFKHNTLLHFVKTSTSTSCNTVSQDTQNTSKDLIGNNNSQIISHSNQNAREINVSQPGTSTTTFSTSVDSSAKFSSTILLATVAVYLTDGRGLQHKIRLLLDSASEANFLTLDCAQQLQLNIRQCDVSIRSINGRNSLVAGKTTVVFCSRFDRKVLYPMEALLVEKITDRLPDYKICSESLTHLCHLPLADDTFDQPGPIQGIIGAQLFGILLGARKVGGSLHAPIAVETKLGYVVMGSAPITFAHSESRQSFHTVIDRSLDTLVSKFWEVEDIPSQKFESPEDSECERIYSSTVKRESSGRYVVALPFKSNPSKLGDSYLLALKRFHSLENRFEKCPKFRDQYALVISEYLREGYLSLLDDRKFVVPHYFIPHHGIFKPESSSTPLRCVFDSSAKTTSDCSLNDLLYTGPKLQADVLDIFLNFRLFPIAFTADIRQMYLRIGIHEPHRTFQQMLWRFSKNEPIKKYCLNTVTFGVKSSPFLALRTLRQLADDEAGNYPLASAVVKQFFYMDDLVVSVSHAEEAKNLYLQLLDLFASGNFQLTKWSVNSKELFKEIPESERSPKIVSFDSDSLKVLGLQWYPCLDVFRFSINTEFRDCTKRNVLSTAARVFDPMGLISPCTLLIKLMIKRLWLLKLDWDEVPSGDIPKQWSHLQRDMELLREFKIPRHLGVQKDSLVILIGFCDACLQSFGAVVYVKTLSKDCKTLVNLVCSKAKVSPMKVQSIPRLELCAALLLAKLLNFVKESLISRVTFENIYAFSDSTVTLSWIASPPCKWQTFVANRVAQIQSLIDSSRWFHVEGQNNISDCLSRGMTPSQFLATENWITGPDWLKLDRKLWPITSISPPKESLPEERKISFATTKVEPHPLYNLISRCSSWKRLIRITVYVLRFLKILKTVGTISSSDIAKAELTLVKLVQNHHFRSEILLMEKKEIVAPYLRSLTPFLHNGLIRVGGRLRNSDLGFEIQHPLLLPKRDHFVDLLIDNCHQQNLHTGPYLVSSILRQKYWILGARNAIRYRLRKCNRCFKLNPKGTFPQMADLPAARVTEAKAFLHCGVDYAGPFFVTMGRRRGIKSQKSYLCLFVCLSTKAIHLELVSDLSTELFLAAFKRFLSRRGACAIIYSDGGRNFLGAKNELDGLFDLVNSEEYKSALETNLVDRKIEWKFQPPLSPHFSGIWESQIKSVKSHLYKVIGSQILTYEELNTVLVQIEALLNSRPLSWLSSDPSDPLPLTPAHFLTLTPLTSLPASNVPDPPKNLLDRKRLLDHLVQRFWSRWRIEYLSQLQSRQKWNTPATPIEIGTLVIIKQDNVPPLRWPCGVVEAVFPGADGTVRVVNVRTTKGLYKRPVVRLCPLPSQ